VLTGSGVSVSQVTIRKLLASTRVTKRATERYTYVNTLRDLLRRARIGPIRARNRAISASLSEEFEVLASSSIVRELGSGRVGGRSVSS
jgi:hypothetical protein